MAEASIDVDLYNPGEVFACLGLLEVAEALYGDAAGAFEQEPRSTHARFCLSTRGEANPVQGALQFLKEAQIVALCPKKTEDQWKKCAPVAISQFPAALRSAKDKFLKENVLPVRLETGDVTIHISHWLGDDGRETSKLFAGQQMGYQLMKDLMQGSASKNIPGLVALLPVWEETSFRDPFRHTCQVKSAFGFDARGSWEALEIGTSLDEQGIGLKVSPLVEILAPIGLEHARPKMAAGSRAFYGAWKEMLPLPLCRLALSAPEAFLPRSSYMFFATHLGKDKYYKKYFFAQLEESS